MTIMLSPPLLMKPRPSSWRQRHTMRAVQVSDIAGWLERLGVNHHDVVAASDKDAIARGIKCEVVPAALAAEFDAIRDFVRFLRKGRDRQQECGGEQTGKNSFHDFSFL